MTESIKDSKGNESPRSATAAEPLGIIVAFLEEIGLPVRFRDSDEAGFLPGITVEAGGLNVDREKLLYPGDLLHEAGHLAVLPPNARDDPLGHIPKQAGLEMAAILAADVAGYSRLMGEDEAGTLSALRRLRTKIFAHTVDQHHGSIVKSVGARCQGVTIVAITVVCVRIESARAMHPTKAAAVMKTMVNSVSVNEIKGLDLPLDCRATYYPDFMAPGESDALFRLIRDDHDQSDQTMKMADGSEYALDFGAMMFVDRALIAEFSEDIWGKIVEWPPLLKTLRDRIERVARHEFRVCRCIYYENGRSGADFHADLPAYGDLSCIASISLGEEREFLFRKIEDHTDIYGLTLGDGSLLIMGKGCQERYEHALPTNDKYKNPRINLTFRPFGWE